MANVLVLAVHPDDETLGCGGVLLKHAQAGDKIHWLIATEMRAESGFTQERMDQRDAEIKKVSGLYGFSDVHQLGLPTTKVDQTSKDKLVNRISEIINMVKPEIIYLPFMGDVHSDHRLIYEAAYGCIKTFRYPFVRKVLMMEVLSETEHALNTKETTFVPNYFVDITSTIDNKLEIMKVYQSELAEPPFPRSLEVIRAQAVYRGSACNCNYAEAFMLIKEIVK